MLIPSAEIWNQLAPLAIKSIVGLIVTGAIMWPFRKIHKEWSSFKSEQTAIREELVHQRSNCLTTLQTQGERQVELLGKAVDILEGVRLEMAEQTGYLRASVPAPPRTRRAAAKK